MTQCRQGQKEVADWDITSQQFQMMLWQTILNCLVNTDRRMEESLYPVLGETPALCLRTSTFLTVQISCHSSRLQEQVIRPSSCIGFGHIRAQHKKKQTPGPVDQSFAGPLYIFTGPERNNIGVIGKGQ